MPRGAVCILRQSPCEKMIDEVATLRDLISGKSLQATASAELFANIMDGTLSPVRVAGLLVALAAKGESVDEIIGAARAMRSRALVVEHSLPLVVDIVGTGGDGENTINISTMAALVVAAAGIPVAKHGNRAASSACGSADVIEAAGMNINLDPGAAARLLHDVGFTFLFAPGYHPAMRNVAPVRRELGVRSIFNILGPLTNPASATHQVVGVSRPELMKPVVLVLQAMGVRRGAVLHARNGIDEVAGDIATDALLFDETHIEAVVIDPQTFGIDIPLTALKGETITACVDAFNTILSGGAHPGSAVVALNAGLAFEVCGHVEQLADGVRVAREILSSGRAAEVFEQAKRASHA